MLGRERRPVHLPRENDRPVVDGLERNVLHVVIAGDPGEGAMVRRFEAFYQELLWGADFPCGVQLSSGLVQFHEH